MHGELTCTTTHATTVPRNRLRSGIGVAIALALSLTACTDDPANVTTPTVGSTVGSTTATPTTQTTPEPIRPAEEATPESAIQFTRYFWDLYNYAYQTYDTAPLKAISDPKCNFCSSTTVNVEKIKASDSRASGFTVQVIEMTSPPVKISTGTLVISVIKQAPGKITSTSSVSNDPGWKQLRTSFSLAWDDGAWRVEGVDADRKNGIR